MEPELGGVDFVGKSGTHIMCAKKQMGTEVALCRSR